MRIGLVKRFVLATIPLAVILTACGGSSQSRTTKTLIDSTSATVGPRPGVAASATKTSIPKQLIGRWGRGDKTVLMIVSPRGKVDVNDTNHAEFSRVTAHQLTVSHVAGLPVPVTAEPSCSTTGTYRWKIANHQVASDQLKLKRIHDACKPRVGLFAGIWLRAYPLP